MFLKCSNDLSIPVPVSMLNPSPSPSLPPSLMVLQRVQPQTSFLQISKSAQTIPISDSTVP